MNKNKSSESQIPEWPACVKGGPLSRPAPRLSRRCPRLLGVIALLGSLGISTMPAASYEVPNGSFESPAPPPGFPVNPSIDAWQEAPQPTWYSPSAFGGVSWDQLTGVFPNPPSSSVANHIDNLHGAQAAYIFAVPGVSLSQDYLSTDWSHTTPGHAFDVRYEVGQSYQLTLGVIGGSGMGEGAGLRLSLYYLDDTRVPVSVATTDIAYSLASFPNITHFQDYQVSTPIVQATDPWAGRSMGIQILSTTLGATYWDVDHVRLTSIPEPGPVGLFALGLVGVWATRIRQSRRL